MTDQDHPTCTAFAGNRRIAGGPLVEVALKVRKRQEQDPSARILVFDDKTGRTVDLDLRGSEDDLRQRFEAPTISADSPKPGPGRPKLGVISREVTLLPRHWEWLGSQPGGASVTLRKLVEDAKKKNQDKDKVRRSKEATYRFMTTMAGDLEGYEEALRNLYSDNEKKLKEHLAAWPKDIREHILKLMSWQRK